MLLSLLISLLDTSLSIAKMVVKLEVYFAKVVCRGCSLKDMAGVIFD